MITHLSAALLAALGFSIAQIFLVNAATFLFLIVPLFVVRLPQPTGELPGKLVRGPQPAPAA